MKNKTCTEQLDSILLEWNAQNVFRIKESSYNKYCYLINRNLIPYLGKYKVPELTTDILQRHIFFLLNGDNVQRPLSPKSVRDTISVLKLALRYARTLGFEVPCDISSLTIRMEKKELRVLTSAEYQKLISYLVGSSNLKDSGILLTLFTGLRIGELCALTWEDINLEEKYICVTHTLQRIQDFSQNATSKTKIIITAPKSFSSKRIIPLPDFLVSYLKQFHQNNNAYFLTGETSYFIEPRSLENHFKKVSSNLQISNITFHTLRHTFATKCVESQFDIKSLSEILGHSSVNITLNCYVHPSLDSKREQMNKLEHLLYTTPNSMS